MMHQHNTLMKKYVFSKKKENGEKRSTVSIFANLWINRMKLDFQVCFCIQTAAISHS